MSDNHDIDALLAIMVALRDPHTGCPWDVQQTFASIAPYTIEEAYEVADAIDRDDLAGLKDELGDLLLQVVFHARMAEEQGAFEFADVVEAICDKMTRRHPDVQMPREAGCRERRQHRDVQMPREAGCRERRPHRDLHLPLAPGSRMCMRRPLTGNNTSAPNAQRVANPMTPRWPGSRVACPNGSVQ